MLEIFKKLISVLTTDATLTALVPANNIYTGRADIVMEKQNTLNYPSVVLTLVSEAVRSVPTNARDTMVQLDIWSRNSQLEIENIYERILTDLDYLSGDQNSAHIWWQILRGAVDLFETDRAVWHRSCSFTLWSIK